MIIEPRYRTTSYSSPASWYRTSRAAAEHAASYFSCWVLYKQTAPGVYEEVSHGGLSSRLTFGLVHPRIRKWVAALPEGALKELAHRI